MFSKRAYLVAGAFLCFGLTAGSVAAQDWRERREERREERQERREERREERQERREERREARRGRWEQLGCKSVGFLVDRDVIRVGRREGRFEAIRFQVSGSTVHMMDVKVVYGRGAPDDIRVRSEIHPGRPTRAYDLRGRERFIREVQMVYRSRPSFRGRAEICAFGRD